MKHIKLITFTLSLFFISNLFADDFYYSLGEKIMLEVQPDIVLLRNSQFRKNKTSNIGGAELAFSKEYSHAKTSFQLFDVKNIKLKNEVLNTEYIFPVFKDKKGKLVLPTENIIVGIYPNTTKADLEKLAKKYSINLKDKDYPIPGMAQFTLLPEQLAKVLEISNLLYEEKETRWAQPDFIAPFYKRAVVNDPLFDIQWHLTNDGHLANATLGADAKVAAAWNTTMGTSSVRICIFDDAVEINHEDLSNNFVAGLDIDTLGPDPSPKLLVGPNAEIHGTACAGVAVARGNNGLGGCGAAPNCSLMGIRWGNTFGGNSIAFYWARTNGADVISCSWGTVMGNILYDAIRDAAVYGRNGLGCTILFAAGNSAKTIDKYDPARHPYVICVTASDANDKRSSYSSYGDVASITAPSSGNSSPGITTTDYMGSDGYSTDNYCRATDATGFGGTSSATPLAAGVAALCLSVNSNLTYLNVKALLQETADKIDSSKYPYNVAGWNEYLGYGRINAGNAVAMAPGYTNTPFSFVSAKGKINSNAGKLSAKLQYQSGMLAGYTGQVIVELDGNVVGTFDAGAGAWKWNKKVVKGKNKAANKDLLKIIAKLTKKQIVLKLKNLTYTPAGSTTEFTLAFTGGQIGKITLNLDSKGKFKQ